ncbi:uncharacterized protein LOC109839008 [Asparagus officinalis]|uniref:uncharacterized protein LOC109839008 n=1 Tax=Asparagus officinalis TaxID=4686 RepID=UPI00098E4B9F|nr:uncharacterized protein LOC109839008 [Asparagus officinalis]
MDKDGDCSDEQSVVNMVQGHKGITQNVLTACTPNKLFTYVLAGWEGSTNDYRILQDVLSRPQPHGLRVYDGKYYLCDARYPTMPGVISPYRGVRYHLSKIESAFGTLKNHFKMLCAKPHYPFPIQVDIVLTCTVLHNFIATVDPSDELLNNDDFNEDIDSEVAFENDTNLVDFTQNQTQREQTESRNE